MKEPKLVVCDYCAFQRMCYFYGRRWLCDRCAEDNGLIDMKTAFERDKYT